MRRPYSGLSRRDRELDAAAMAEHYREPSPTDEAEYWGKEEARLAAEEAARKADGNHGR